MKWVSYFATRVGSSGQKMEPTPPGDQAEVQLDKLCKDCLGGCVVSFEKFSDNSV